MTLARCARFIPQTPEISGAVGSVHAMSTARPRLRIIVLALAVGALLSACGKSGVAPVSAGGPAGKIGPLVAQGTVSVSTRNTTRLGGSDAATDAAAVARAVYPGFTPASRPQAVVVVDERDWAGALAASVLASSPLGAPLLYANRETLPEVSTQTLQAMHPVGASALGGAQVIRIGTSAPVGGDSTRSITAHEPAAEAAAIEQLLLQADGGASPHQAIVLPANAPRALQMPAAGLAAESGAPILFVGAERLSMATAMALARLHRPTIYVIDASQVGNRTLGELTRYGRVTTLTGAGAAGEDKGAVANSIAVARFNDGTFGWGVREPGHGLVFANAARPLDGPSSAILSASGDFGPLLVLESAYGVPSALATYLGDIQPAYTAAVPPVRAVYNHGWLIGDEHAISAVTQAELDSVLEITQRKQASEEPSGTPVE
jgi:ell wall binding domain 2 (CWB2)